MDRKPKPPARFDLHRQLRWLGLLDGRFDRRRVRPTGKALLVHLVWMLSLAHVLARFLLIPHLTRTMPTDRRLHFLLGHFMYFLEARYANLVYYYGALMLVWTALLMQVFRRLSRRTRCAHWMRHFAVDGQPDRLPGISAEQLHRYRTHADRTLRRIRRWFVLGLTGTLQLANSRYYLTPSALPGWAFWPVCLANVAYMHLYSTQVNACAICLPVCVGLLCQLQGTRFANVRDRLHRLAAQAERRVSDDAKPKRPHDAKGWLARLESVVSCFQLVALDLLRMNRFWSRVFLLNLHFGMGTVVLGVFGAYATGSWMMITVVCLINASIYVFALLLPIYFAGGLVERINSAYRPIKKLLLLPQVPPRVKLKLLDMIGFMESGHCGFTCQDMFVIRHVHIIKSCASIVVSFMLIFDLVFFKNAI